MIPARHRIIDLLARPVSRRVVGVRVSFQDRRRRIGRLVGRRRELIGGVVPELVDRGRRAIGLLLPGQDVAHRVVRVVQLRQR